MDGIFTGSFYGLAALLLLLSFVKDKRKTVLSLKKASKMFVNVLPQFLGILLVTGLVLSLLPTQTIRQLVGGESGFAGMLLAALTGAVTLVPVLAAFPLASQLLAEGAGIAQMAVFISALTTVGVLTLPMEIKFLGKKAAVLRNVFSFLLSFLIAFLMGALI